MRQAVEMLETAEKLAQQSSNHKIQKTDCITLQPVFLMSVI